MDKFAWIREKKDPNVIELLDAENEKTKQYLLPLKKLEDQIYAEMLGRIKESDVTVPYKLGDYSYYSTTQEGQNYSCFYRKKISTQAGELLLDLNLLAKESSYLSLGDFSVSPDQTKLAYSLDTDGSEFYKIVTRNLQDQTIEDELPAISDGSIVWSLNGLSYFYVTLDETHRPFKVWRHLLGTPTEKDLLIYTETDQRFHVEICSTKDDKYLLIESQSKTTSEVWYLSLAADTVSPTLIQPKVDGMLYSVFHRQGHFLILTNHEAVNFKVMSCPVDQCTLKNWKELLPYDPNRRIDDLEVFQDYLGIFERFNGLTHVRIYNFNSKEIHNIVFDDASYYVSPGDNYETSSTKLRLYYQSPITPESVYDYDMSLKKLELLKRSEIPSGYSKENYHLEYLQAIAHDGESIPITLLRKAGAPQETPLLLNGYGAYEISRDPYFQRSWFSLIDRGWSVAIAHIRGGGEKGRDWYEQGKLLNKKNTFLDFISAADFLVAKKYTAEGQIAIRGGSAGGLLMGAVVNMRPKLWSSVLALVPFVDTFNTMLDESLPLTITEYDEWGNPQHEPYRAYIQSYSPYDNVIPADYPAILATGGINDPRVGFWEPVKWILKIRENNLGTKPLLLKIDMGSGHGGPSGRYARLREEATLYSFIIDQAT